MDIERGCTPVLTAEWKIPFSNNYSVLISVSGLNCRATAHQLKTPVSVEVSARVGSRASVGNVIAFEVVAVGVFATPASAAVN
jgi:hypothetical protein